MSESFKSSINLILIKIEKKMKLNMVEVIIGDLTEKKEDYSKIKRNLIEKPLEKSLDNILDQIDLDIVKILKYNRI